MFLVFLKSCDEVFVVEVCLVVVNVDFVFCNIFFKDKFFVFGRIIVFGEVCDFDKGEFVCCKIFFKDNFLVFWRVVNVGEVWEFDKCDLVCFKIFVKDRYFGLLVCLLDIWEKIFWNVVFFWGVIMLIGFMFVLYGNECDFGIGKGMIFGLSGEFKYFLLIFRIVVWIIGDLWGFFFGWMFVDVEVIFNFLGFVFCCMILEVRVIFKFFGFKFLEILWLVI